ncbi:MAG: TonB-dependent receptor [Pseudomonadota bacterium]
MTQYTQGTARKDAPANFRKTVLATLIASLMLPVAANATGAGQQAAAKPAATPAAEATPAQPLEVIVVTARKRTEALQNVPVAISAFSADTLERAKIVAAPDLQFSIPNAVLTGNDRFTIRGIGNNSLGGDNGVGLSLNGASIGYLPQDEFYDIERIEVLRGPQGTLFGRNTTGGGIAVSTKRANAKFGGEFNVELGNYNTTRFGGTINIPINDTVMTRFSGYSLKRDGYTRNEFTGNNIDGRDQYGLRNSTRLDFDDYGQINLMLGVYKEDSSRAREGKRLCKASPVLGCSATELGFDSPDANATILQTLAKFFTPFPAGGNIYAGALNPTDMRAVAADTDPTFRMKHRFGTLDYTVDMGQFSATYVAGYSNFSSEQNTDWDNAALPFRFTTPITYNMDRNTVVTTDRILTTDSAVAASQTWSHEMRVSSQFKGMFNFTGGLFHLRSSGSGGFFIWSPMIERFQKAQGRPPETWFINGETKRSTTKATALFGEGELKFSDKLRATLGARLTEEKKTSLGRNIVLTGTVPFKQSELDWKWWTGRASIDYAPNRDTLLYGSVSTGYKGGGFNAGNAAVPEFDPETVTAYEIGLKTTMLDRKLRANFSLFYNDYADMQLAQRIAGSAITSNADAKIRGAEAEFLWAPTKSVLLDLNLSYLDTKIGNFMTVDAANPAQSATVKTPEVQVNLRGNDLPHSPSSKYKLGAQYTMGLFGSGWNATARVDHVHQASYYAREFNTNTDRIGAWGVTNLQLRFTSPDNKVEIKTFVKNVSDADNLTNIIIEDALIGSYRNVRLLDPRTVGVQVQYKF